jgi:putative Ca2+/H+ antiporter (TMEM165/GDT1 family)
MTTVFLSSITSSFFLIFLSEITDKTFIIIILMTSKLPSLILYITALSATLLMNYISIGLGYLLPLIINQTVMNCIAFSLFLMFGIISIMEGKAIEKNNGLSDLFELTKKELEIEEEEEQDYYLMVETEDNEYDMKTEATTPHNSRIKSNIKNNEIYNNKTTYGLCFALFITFLLSDIGDKSQIATITIAAVYNLYGVIIGTTLAFILSCALGILCGNFICQRISTKNIMYIGGGIFLLFAGELLYKLTG